MLSKRERAERVAAKIEAAQAVLAEQVAELQSGGDWTRFLGFQARLHQYSANNVMLIVAQHAQAHSDGLVPNPEPTYVAGFKTWKALGRSVDKGQHGYLVLAPTTGWRRVALDEQGHVRQLGQHEPLQSGESEDRRKTLRGFKVEYVFELGQTSGAAVPEPVRPSLLEGEAPPGLGSAVMRLVEDRGFRVDTVANAAAIGGANGQTSWPARTVVVRADMDDAAMVKSLIHEAAHVLLHDDPPGRFLPRPVKEVEAESVAYVVAAAHGMATDDYSFPYVAAWAGEHAANTVQSTQARVARAAKTVIEASPAGHEPGGKVPGADAAIAAARQAEAEAGRRREELTSQLSVSDNGPAA